MTMFLLLMAALLVAVIGTYKAVRPSRPHTDPAAAEVKAVIEIDKIRW